METKTRKEINIESATKIYDEIHPLKVVFDQMGDHVVITDENANIVYANKAVERHTGFPYQESLGKNPGDLWGGKMPKEFYEKMWYRIKVEKEPFVGEVKNERKDGSAYWQELRITPVLNSGGDISYFIGIEPKITERKDRDEARENFVSAFDNKIQNSLDGMRKTINWLSLNANLNSKEEDRLREMYQQHHNFSILISDFLSLLKNPKLPE